MFRILICFIAALSAGIPTCGLPPGFKIELFAGPTLITNIAAFSIDQNGRFFVVETFRHPPASTNLESSSVEERVELLRKERGARFYALTNASERVRLVEDRNHDGKAETEKIFAQGFNRPFDGVARSILAAPNGVYFACSPDIWLLTENRRQSIHTGFGIASGNPEHDLDGLTMGPDGRLYFGMGDRGLNVTSREGTPHRLKGEGAILRCEPDGSKLEIFARGLQHPRGLAFNELGDLFAIDGPRLLNIVEHGDYGWRLPASIPSTLPALTNFSAEPTCLAYSDETSLPMDYQRALFFGASNEINAVHLQPRGASYEIASTENFLTGMTPTDLQFGLQAGLYFSDVTTHILRLHDPTFKKASKAPLPQNAGQLAAVILSNTNLDTSLRAVWALGQIARKGAVEAQQSLLFAAQSNEPEIRAQAARCLGDFEHQANGPALQKLLADPAPRARLFAALSLRRVKYPAVQEALFAMMKDPDPWLAHAAKIAMNAIVEKN